VFLRDLFGDQEDEDLEDRLPVRGIEGNGRFEPRVLDSDTLEVLDANFFLLAPVGRHGLP
jgi:hypothetical protein